MRLAVLASHPVQYQTPFFRALAQVVDLQVLYACQATRSQQAEAGFGVAFDWDVDLMKGYASEFLVNRAAKPGPLRFTGADTPGIGRRLTKGRFDALLVGGWRLKAFCQGVVAAKRLGLPVMVRGDSHLQTPRSPAKRMIKAATYPSLLRLFDAALPVGRRSHDYYRHYGYPRDCIFASPHCVDIDRFASHATLEARVSTRTRHGVGAEERVVLFAGKLMDFKRPLDAVDACAALSRARRGVRLCVAGSGELEAAVSSRAAATGLHLTMMGFQNQSAMPGVYAAADVLILPSDGRETWGLVCNEAIACGRPIVVSDAAGCSPDLGASPVGQVYPVGDIEMAAAALAAALTKPCTAADFATVSRTHSPAAAAAGVVAAMDHLVSRPREARLRP